ncbi:unnamed protein product, partial [marine sediment metagenome]
KGFLDLIEGIKSGYTTVESDSPGEVIGTCLVDVYEDGEILKEYTLAEVRERAV